MCPGMPLTLHNSGGVGVRAHGTLVSVVTGSTVRCRLSVEAETFDGALVTVTLETPVTSILSPAAKVSAFMMSPTLSSEELSKFELFKNSLL